MAHLIVTTYLGVRHYDNNGVDFDTMEQAEKFKRRCEMGSGRSGGSAAATISTCECERFAR